MSIVIKGLDLPRDTSIKLVVRSDGYVWRMDSWDGGGRWLEAEQLPSPHGRLIDADALRREIDANRPERIYEDGWELNVMDYAPTIIEEEGGNE